MNAQSLLRAPRVAADVVSRLVHHKGFHLAASASYRSLFAFFPFLVCVLSTMAAFGQAEELSDGMDAVKESGALSGEMVDAFRSQLDRLADGIAGSHLLQAALMLLLALWSGSAGIRAVMLGLNSALELEEHRSVSRRVLTSIVLGLVTGVTIVAATVMVAGGPAIADLLAELPGTKGLIHDAWTVARWPLAGLILFAWLALLASVAPATRQTFRIFTRGNCVAFLVWLGFTLAFSWYVDNLGSQGKVYGVFTGAIVLMLHAYWSSLIIFIGAEVDGLAREAAQERHEVTGGA